MKNVYSLSFHNDFRYEDKKSQLMFVDEVIAYFEANRAGEERHYVMKGISWAARQIGKRNRVLHKAALSCGRQMIKSDSKSTPWIASDVLRELHDVKIKKE